GACALGYADADVNNAVIQAVNQGSASTLNSYEEIDLAERLIELHPWAKMARFTRGGGEACSVAIRIARAATGRDKIAFCGYHGWHDWYIAANISDKSSLDTQLLPGLPPNGVPKGLKNTIFPFNYNNIDELEEIVQTHLNEIGVIIMEPQRDEEPNPGFLEHVREIANSINAVLIFDEVTSAFRINYGGIHLVYNVSPDIAVFGKALGNGFPIAAIIGTRKIMEHAQNSFISSTFWTERIGFVAALATLKKMGTECVQEKMVYFGTRIKNGWEQLARKHNLNIKIDGIITQLHIHFNYKDQLAIDTLLTQEMLLKGYLAGTQIYVTYAYTDSIIDKYLLDLDFALVKIKVAIDSGKIQDYLLNEQRNPNFKRLTGGLK
ncbi:MAG: aminotransferase class III-fold pyridoxal phosphate-dependent enzyme, partial [Ignavibacteria bacterium]|nr:aminotransferase class III-fold pyridoxal phosphate-dependent enzyme [Ignavibacteria bacterium]